MTDQQDPLDAVPVFPTQEGGAVPAEEFFSGTVWHYLVVLDVTGVPTILCDPLQMYLVRAAYDFLGENKFSLWNNNNSIAIACQTTPEMMDLFTRRVREAATIFATHHIVRMNRYVMSIQRQS